MSRDHMMGFQPGEGEALTLEKMSDKEVAMSSIGESLLGMSEAFQAYCRADVEAVSSLSASLSELAEAMEGTPGWAEYEDETYLDYPADPSDWVGQTLVYPNENRVVIDIESHSGKFVLETNPGMDCAWVREKYMKGTD